MLKGKLDIKMIFILVLGAALLLSWLFRPAKKIDMYEDELKVLNEQNDSLIIYNGNLKTVNDSLKGENIKIVQAIDSTQVELDKSSDRINDLENGKGKVSGYVNTLSADGVANGLSEYLNNRKDYEGNDIH